MTPKQMHLLSQIQKDERRTTFPVSRSAHSDSARPDMIQGAAADRAGTSSFTAAQRRHNAATLSARGSACCPLKEPGLGCVVVCSLHPKYKRRRGAGRTRLPQLGHPLAAQAHCRVVCVSVCECVRTLALQRNYRGVIRRDCLPPGLSLSPPPQLYYPINDV